MFKKGALLTFKLFIILFLCCLIILCFVVWIEMNKSYQLTHPNGEGIEFFTQIAGLLIPHFTFFGICSLWLFIVRFFTRDFKKYTLISFIPIFIFWSFYFIIYAVDYSVPFFYFGEYETLRSIDLF